MQSQKLTSLIGTNNFIEIASLSLCSLDLNPIGQLTGPAQVAGEQKRLDARIQWLAAFSQVGPQSTEDFSEDENWNLILYS